MTTSTKYCSFCGAQLTDTSRYCIQCGAPVEDSTETPAAEPVNSTIKIEDMPNISPEPVEPEPMPTPAYNLPQNMESPRVSTQPSNRRPTWLIIILVILAICLCLGCIVSIGAGAFFINVRSETTPASVAVITQEVSQIPEPILPETALPVPTDSVIIPEAPTFPGREVFTQGIRFNLSQDVAGDIFAETIPAETGSNIPEWEIGPEYIRINFSGYQSTGETFHQPQLLIYPADQYAEVNQGAAGIIENLKLVLTTKSNSSSDDYLPFLPLWNAGQIFHSNITYLDFQNGSGVRYLTQYGQDVYPINNYSLFYTFQGLTSDERYYIAAIFPVSNPVLPDPESIQMDQAFYDTFLQYIEETKFLLNTQSPENFSPSLIVLDQLIESLKIER